MRGGAWLIAAVLAACLALGACGGPVERPGRGEGGNGPTLKPLAAGLNEPRYHNPAGRWRAEHGGLVVVGNNTLGAGFELGECLLCHQTRGCNACHSYTGARRLPVEAWR